VQQPGLLAYTLNSLFSDSTYDPELHKIELMCYDIKLETIRDFGKYLKRQLEQGQTEMNLEGEGPDALELHCGQIKENSDDPVQVKNLASIPIDNYAQVQEIIEAQETLRSRLDKKQKISPEFYHQVYILQVRNNRTN